MSELKVYLSGKISGLTEEEYMANFKNAWSKVYDEHIELAICGKSVIYNPCDIKPLFGIKKYWFFMIADLYTLIFKCNSIYLLDNWKESKGAKIELFVALLLNKKIL